MDNEDQKLENLYNYLNYDWVPNRNLHKNDQPILPTQDVGLTDLHNGKSNDSDMVYKQEDLLNHLDFNWLENRKQQSTNFASPVTTLVCESGKINNLAPQDDDVIILDEYKQESLENHLDFDWFPSKRNNMVAHSNPVVMDVPCESTSVGKIPSEPPILNAFDRKPSTISKRTDNADKTNLSWEELDGFGFAKKASSVSTILNNSAPLREIVTNSISNSALSLPIDCYRETSVKQKFEDCYTNLFSVESMLQKKVGSCHVDKNEINDSYISKSSSSESTLNLIEHTTTSQQSETIVIDDISDFNPSKKFKLDDIEDVLDFVSRESLSMGSGTKLPFQSGVIDDIAVLPFVETTTINNTVNRLPSESDNVMNSNRFTEVNSQLCLESSEMAVLPHVEMLCKQDSNSLSTSNNAPGPFSSITVSNQELRSLYTSTQNTKSNSFSDCKQESRADPVDKQTSNETAKTDKNSSLCDNGTAGKGIQTFQSESISYINKQTPRYDNIFEIMSNTSDLSDGTHRRFDISNYSNKNTHEIRSSEEENKGKIISFHENRTIKCLSHSEEITKTNLAENKNFQMKSDSQSTVSNKIDQPLKMTNAQQSQITDHTESLNHNKDIETGINIVTKEKNVLWKPYLEGVESSVGKQKARWQIALGNGKMLDNAIKVKLSKRDMYTGNNGEPKGNATVDENVNSKKEVYNCSVSDCGLRIKIKKTNNIDHVTHSDKCGNQVSFNPKTTDNLHNHDLIETDHLNTYNANVANAENCVVDKVIIDNETIYVNNDESGKESDNMNNETNCLVDTIKTDDDHINTEKGYVVDRKYTEDINRTDDENINTEKGYVTDSRDTEDQITNDTDRVIDIIDKEDDKLNNETNKSEDIMYKGDQNMNIETSIVLDTTEINFGNLSLEVNHFTKSMDKIDREKDNNDETSNLMNKQECSMDNETMNVVNKQECSLDNETRNNIDKQEYSMDNETRNIIDKQECSMDNETRNIIDKQECSMDNETRNIIDKQECSMDNETRNVIDKQDCDMNNETKPMDVDVMKNDINCVNHIIDKEGDSINDQICYEDLNKVNHLNTDHQNIVKDENFMNNEAEYMHNENVDDRLDKDAENMNNEIHCPMERSTQQDENLNNEIHCPMERSTQQNENMNNEIHCPMERSTQQDENLNNEIHCPMERSTQQNENMNNEIHCPMERSTQHNINCESSSSEFSYGYESSHTSHCRQSNTNITTQNLSGSIPTFGRNRHETNIAIFCETCPDFLVKNGNERLRHNLTTTHLIRRFGKQIFETKKFECNICSTRYSSRKTLVSHYKRYHGKNAKELNTDKCVFCNYYRDIDGKQLTNTIPADRYRVLKIHYDSHKGRSDGIVSGIDNSCDICNQIFISKQTLEEHIPSHFENYNNICVLCNENFPDRNVLIRHVPTHVQSQNNGHSTDNNTDNGNGDLSNETRYDEDNSPRRTRQRAINYTSFFEANSSNEEDFSDDDESDYIQNESTDESCDDDEIERVGISRTIALTTDRNRHIHHIPNVDMRNKDGGTTNNERNIRQNSINCTETSNEISNQEDNNQMLKCYICSLTLTSKESLNEHIGTHFRRKLFRCALCQQEFQNRMDLINHLSNHDTLGKEHHSCGPWIDLTNDTNCVDSNIPRHGSVMVDVEMNYRRNYISPVNNSNTNQNKDHRITQNITQQESVVSCNNDDARDNKENEEMALFHQKLFKCTFCSYEFQNRIDLINHLSDNDMMHKDHISCGPRIGLTKAIKSLDSNIQRRCREKVAEGINNREICSSQVNNGDDEYNPDENKEQCITQNSTPKENVVSYNIDNIIDKVFNEEVKNASSCKKKNSKLLECYICLLPMPSEESLNEHIGTHFRHKLYKCAVCQQEFQDRTDLINHLANHERVAEQGHSCGPLIDLTNNTNCIDSNIPDRGNEKVDGDINKRENSSSQSDNPNQNNTQNSTQNESVVQYNNDTITAHDVNEEMTNADKSSQVLKCYICSITLASEESLNEHIGTHFHQRLFKCAFCTEKFQNRIDLINHLSFHDMILKDRMPFGQRTDLIIDSHCVDSNMLGLGSDEVYDKMNSSKANNSGNVYNPNKDREHRITQNSTPKENVVSYNIDDKELNEKVKNGSNCKKKNSKLLECYICLLNMPSEESLDEHIGTHFRHKLYKCAVCQQEFQDRTDLINHLANHERVAKQSPSCGPLIDLTNETNCVDSIIPDRDSEDINNHEKCSSQSDRSDELYEEHRKTQNSTQNVSVVPYNNAAHITDKEVNVKMRYALSCQDGNSQVLKCYICSVTLASEDTLNEHIATHFRQQLFKCALCKQEFQSHMDLINHLANHDTVRKRHHVCEPWIDLTKDTNQEDPNIPNCDNENVDGGIDDSESCSSQDNTSNDLYNQNQNKEHHTTQNSKQKDVDFSCKFCPEYKAKSVSEIQRHGTTTTHLIRRFGKTYLGNKKYECNICSVRFNGKHTFVGHYENFHGKYVVEGDTKDCIWCKYYRGLGEEKESHKYRVLKKHYFSHIARSHCKKTFESNYCDICNNTPTQALSEHIPTHFENYNTICFICKEECHDRSGLVNHIPTHFEHYRFTCMFCNQRCHDIDDLTQHIPTHFEVNLNRETSPFENDTFSENEKVIIEKLQFNDIWNVLTWKRDSARRKFPNKVKCKTCPNFTTASRDLMKLHERMTFHVRTRFGANGLKYLKYECPICSARYKTVSYFRDHYKTKHVPTQLDDNSKGNTNEEEANKQHLNEGEKKTTPTPQQEKDDLRHVYNDDENTLMATHKDQVDASTLDRGEEDPTSVSNRRDNQPCMLASDNKNESISLLSDEKENIPVAASAIYKCDMCLEIFSSERNFNEHIQSHFQMKSFICELCKREFPKRDDLKNHMFNHKTNGLQCDMCEQRFHSSDEVRAHRSSYHRMPCNDKFPCVKCTRVFKTEKGLEAHVKRIHIDKVYGCKYCGKEFRFRDKLEVHTIGVHTKEFQLRCHICGKGFLFQGNLDDHINEHEGIQKYQCEKCGEKFTGKAAKWRHMRVHKLKEQGPNPDQVFVCDVCGKKFAKEHSLKLHLYVHTGKKTFTCDICDRSFARGDNLLTHMRTHTGDKPYKCDNCGKTFARLDNLKTHIRKMHK